MPAVNLEIKAVLLAPEALHIANAITEKAQWLRNKAHDVGGASVRARDEIAMMAEALKLVSLKIHKQVAAAVSGESPVPEPFNEPVVKALELVGRKISSAYDASCYEGEYGPESTITFRGPDEIEALEKVFLFLDDQWPEVENAAREAGVTMATARAWLARMRLVSRLLLSSEE